MGLGDGLISLVLSNNLQLNGCSVTTFHPFLDALQDWFPHLPLRRFPASEEGLEDFDRYFIIYEKSPWMQQVLTYCEKHFPERTTILNPIATPNRDYPYWENGRFDGNRPFVDNLYVFCKDLLRLPILTKGNGIVIPDAVQPRRYENRVIFHPTSSRPGKNWPQEKYLKLASQLKKQGYHPIFILTKEERKEWDVDKIDAPLFNNLSELSAFICESGYMIGNDSGIGHLASCLGLPTLTICRSAQAARFWRPAWINGEVITPSPWIPNLKGLRWRDKHWQKWVTIPSALKCFHRLNRDATYLQK
jgi:heptosyltransferase III